jgi:hypothetical protein
MMDDTKYGPTASWTELPAESAPASGNEVSEASESPDQAQTAGADQAGNGASPAVEKFQSCRWRATPDAGDFCTHRDVLPFAGKEGFKPESWCPECAFYKLRRTPKKRERSDYMY